MKKPIFTAASLIIAAVAITAALLLTRRRPEPEIAYEPERIVTAKSESIVLKKDTVTTGDKTEDVQVEYWYTKYRQDGDIATHNNIKLISCKSLYLWKDAPGDGIAQKFKTALIRYENDTPTDTAMLIGPHNRILGNDKYCHITVGTDTLTLDYSKGLPKTIDLRFHGVLPGCEFHTFTWHDILDSLDRPSDFQVNIAVPKNVQSWVLDKINEHLFDTANDYFTTEDEAVGPIAIYKADSIAIKSMVAYYHDQVKEKIPQSGWISLLAEASAEQYYYYPTWISPDSTLVTYRSYSYTWGGDNGGSCDYYITFNIENGTPIDIEDIFNDAEFKKADKKIGNELYEYDRQWITVHWPEIIDRTINFGAAIKDTRWYSNEDDDMHQWRNGSLYPRPALSKYGIVFTYNGDENSIVGYDISRHVLIKADTKNIAIGRDVSLR